MPCPTPVMCVHQSCFTLCISVVPEEETEQQISTQDATGRDEVASRSMHSQTARKQFVCCCEKGRHAADKALRTDLWAWCHYTSSSSEHQSDISCHDSLLCIAQLWALLKCCLYRHTFEWVQLGIGIYSCCRSSPCLCTL